MSIAFVYLNKTIALFDGWSLLGKFPSINSIDNSLVYMSNVMYLFKRVQ